MIALYSLEMRNRIESRSDDLDNLGHLGDFLMGQVDLTSKLAMTWIFMHSLEYGISIW